VPPLLGLEGLVLPVKPLKARCPIGITFRVKKLSMPRGVAKCVKMYGHVGPPRVYPENAMPTRTERKPGGAERCRSTRLRPSPWCAALCDSSLDALQEVLLKGGGIGRHGEIRHDESQVARG
jgi:hypothetical protein